ncbi:MAG: hypothetical protein V4615_09290, partial [Bacteroidota bacterium]
GNTAGSNVTIDNSAGTSMLYARNIDSYVGVGTSSPTSRLHNAGSFALPVRSTTATATLAATDYCLIFTGSSLSQTINIPSAIGITGRVYSIVNHSTVTVNISTVRTGSVSTISTLAAGVALQIISDGTSWRQIN